MACSSVSTLAPGLGGEPSTSRPLQPVSTEQASAAPERAEADKAAASTALRAGSALTSLRASCSPAGLPGGLPAGRGHRVRTKHAMAPRFGGLISAPARAEERQVRTLCRGPG